MRPLNLGETLDASIKIVRARWRTLVTVMVVVALPIQLLDVLVISSTTDVYQVGTGFTAGTSNATTYSDEGAYVTGQAVIQLLGLFGSLLGTVACYRAIADSYLGRATTAGQSLRFAAGRFGRTLWLAILLVVLLIPAFVLFALPGVWLLVAWSVAIPAMLVEGPGGFAALRRSFGLVKDRWWATFGRFVVAYILVTVVTAAATFVLLLPTSGLIDDTSFGALVLQHFATFIVSLITTPFIAAVVTLVYFDLRVRKEGFDLAVLAERMGGAPAEGPAPVGASGGGGGGGAGAGAFAGTGGFAAPAGARDAFGDPIRSIPPPTPRPSSPSGTWAPPVAPEPHSPPVSSASPDLGRPPSPPAEPEPHRPPSPDE